MDMSAWIRGDMGGGLTRSGVAVTPNGSLRMGAQWSSVHLLASIVSNLPVDVFRGSGVSKTPVSPQPGLVGAPSLTVSRREWMYQGMVSLLLRGNAYGYVLERDALQRPRVVEWLNPDSVRAEQASALARVTYEVGGSPVDADSMVHLRAFVQPGSAIGMSPVEYHAETIGVGLAAQKFGAQWFGDGAHPTAILKGDASEDQARTVKERFKAMLKGNREPLVLGSGWEYIPLQVSANESQFIESMNYSDAQVARLYGPGLAEVLGYAQAGSSLTYTNRVDRSLDLLTYSVMPWVNKWEDFLTGAIAQPQTVRFNTNAMLRADNKSRHEIYQIDRNIGLYSVDELRALEDQPPLPDGMGSDPSPLGAKPAGGAPDVNQ